MKLSIAEDISVGKVLGSASYAVIDFCREELGYDQNFVTRNHLIFASVPMGYEKLLGVRIKKNILFEVLQDIDHAIIMDSEAENIGTVVSRLNPGDSHIIIEQVNITGEPEYLPKTGDKLELQDIERAYFSGYQIEVKH